MDYDYIYKHTRPGATRDYYLAKLNAKNNEGKKPQVAAKMPKPVKENKAVAKHQSKMIQEEQDSRKKHIRMPRYW